MAELGPVVGDIRKYFEERLKEREAVETKSYDRTISSAKEMYKNISAITTELEKQFGTVTAKKVSEIAARIGLDEKAVKSSKKYYDTVRDLQRDIAKKRKEENVSFKEAIGLQLKEINDLKKIDASLNSRLSREEKVLEKLREQYNERTRYMKLEAMSRKIMGTTATKMAKVAIGGEGLKKIDTLIKKLHKIADFVDRKGGALGEFMSGSKSGRALSAISAAIVGITHATFKGMLTTAIHFTRAMDRIWDEGLAGIYRTSVDILASIGGAITPSLGTAISTIGNFLVKNIMFVWEDQIQKATMGVRMRAATGRGGGEALFDQMLKTTGGIRDLTVEWGSAAIETSSRVSGKFASDFYRLGRTMMLGADETAEYYKKALISADENVAKAHTDVRKLFGQSQEMAKKTGLTTKFFASAISDAAVQARLFNVDMQSVTNTMKDLVGNQKNLAAFGISTRDQGQKILSALTTAPQQWSMAVHAFAGLETYGKEFREETGKAMSAAEGYLASRFGLEASKTISRAEGGGFTVGGPTGEGDLMGNRLDMIKAMVEKSTAGMGAAEAYMTGEKLLADVFKITGTAATAILTGGAKEGGAIKPEVQAALLSEKEIQDKMLTVQQRQEQIQRALIELLPTAINLLYLLPSKIADFIWSSPESRKGSELFDEAWQKALDKMSVVVKPLEKFGIVFKDVKESRKAMLEARLGTKEEAARLLKEKEEEVEYFKKQKDVNYTYTDVLKDKEDELRSIRRDVKSRYPNLLEKGTYHSGGTARAGMPSIVQPTKEMFNLAGDEAMMIPGSNMEVIPYNKTAGGGRMSQINITLYGYNSPADILTAVQEGLAGLA